jgi:hypothetical protein
VLDMLQEVLGHVRHGPCKMTSVIRDQLEHWVGRVDIPLREGGRLGPTPTIVAEDNSRQI